ncbi:alpha/beta fold hydrolase [Wenyingzhuangia sp. IMCC45533]
MKKFIYLLTLVFAFSSISCSTVKKENKNAYLEFRNRQKSFQSSDGALKYIDEGKGDKVILLLHGVPTSSWLYRKMIPLLTTKGYRVIAPDMLGYGSSDNPKGYEIYNEANHAKRILALMNHLNIQHWHHVMHDAGGLWTWELIKQAPDKITKLSVLNTIIYKEGFNPPIRMEKGIIAKSAMWLYNNGFTTSKMLNMLFKEGLTNPDMLSESEFYGYKKPLLEDKTKGMYYFFTQTCNTFPDYRVVFEKLTIPTQFIWGKNDKMLQIDPQLSLIKKGFDVDDSQIYLLDAKHFIQEEKPNEIVEKIVNL